MYIYIYMCIKKRVIYIYIHIYNQFLIFDNLILGRGDYNNAQPAKSYFGLFRFGSWHFLEMASLRNASFLLPLLLQYQSSKFKTRPRPKFELC